MTSSHLVPTSSRRIRLDPQEEHDTSSTQVLMHPGDHPLSILVRYLRQQGAWVKDAACREHEELTWFTERGESQREIKAVCSACLVRAECAAYALDNDIAFGTWGGLSQRERRQGRRWSA